MSTSGSNEGGGSLKASKPGKKLRILSATLPALSPCEHGSDLKTYVWIKQKQYRSKLQQNTSIFDISKKKENFIRAP